MNSAPIADSLAYFSEDDLRESLVLSTGYTDIDKQFVLVIAYANLRALLTERPSASREAGERTTRQFRRYIFSDCTLPKRTNVLVRCESAAAINYSMPRIGGGHAIQSLNLERGASRPFAIAIDCGTFGTFAFEFTAVVETRRCAYAVRQQGQHWLYADAVTNEPVDFFAPFGK